MGPIRVGRLLSTVARSQRAFVPLVSRWILRCFPPFRFLLVVNDVCLFPQLRLVWMITASCGSRFSISQFRDKRSQLSCLLVNDFRDVCLPCLRFVTLQVVSGAFLLLVVGDVSSLTHILELSEVSC